MASPTRIPTLDVVVRVSRRNGRSGDSFLSPSEQKAACRQLADRTGATIRRYWDETDSVSGGTVEREGLQAAIADALSGKTDGLLVAKIDRFARTVQGGLSAITRLEDAGKLLWSAREGVIVGDTRATATDQMIRTFWLMLAEWQRGTLAEGFEAARESHIDRGVPNYSKFGYVKDPKTRRLIPDVGEYVQDPEMGRLVPGDGFDKAAWVVPMFERRASGTSWADIADWLRDEGVPGNWGINSVKQIIGSRIYLGEIRSGESFVNPDAHDPLVSPELWNRANSVATTSGPRREAEPYMLTGVIRCASCGVRMFGMADRRTNAQGDEVVYRVYRCRGRHGAWGRCPAPARVVADDVEALVDAEFRAVFLSGKKAEPSEATGEVEAAEAELRAAEAELDAFVVAAEALRADLFHRGLSARQARVDAAEEAVAEARSAVLGVSLPAGLAKVWDGLPVDEKRQYIADAFAVVAVARGRGPAAERVCTWLAGDPAIPGPLPGRGGCSVLSSIEFREGC